jgi:hypothetical protein
MIETPVLLQAIRGSFGILATNYEICGNSFLSIMADKEDDFAKAESRFRSYVERNMVWAAGHQPSADWTHYPAHAACAVSMLGLYINPVMTLTNSRCSLLYGCPSDS